MHNISIKTRHYKCFTKEAGFNCIKHINVIIGRNNSGKSSLLDIIESVARSNYQFDPSTWRNGQPPSIIFESTIPEEVCSKIFPTNVTGGQIGYNHSIYGRKFIGRTIRWSKGGEHQNKAQLIDCEDADITPKLENSGDYGDRLANNMPIKIQGLIFKKISAERDIIPEADKIGHGEIQSNGSGITSLIQAFINYSNLPSDLVESTILSSLNEIFAHDAQFIDIVCQRYDNNFWEIYLEEEHKGRIALSKSGSGLKTVIMVLVFIHLIPHIENNPLNKYIYAFEELENNLHPSLLRRLTEYVYNISKNNQCPIFLTTHSNILIDQFSKQKDAQIIHVKQSANGSTCNTVKTYIDNNGILDDLDVRASDILQANGIIWVEGPSDRIYLNHWIRLWSNEELREGTHYQCLIYGGRLLSHLSADDPDLVEECVSILKVNRNSIIILDSDKRNRQTPINDTKKRVISEITNHGSMAWLTKGREIENYIPNEAVSSLFGISNPPQVNQFESFFSYLDSCAPGKGSKYKHKKTLLSESIVAHMTKANMTSILDIDEKISKVCSLIRQWNS